MRAHLRAVLATPPAAPFDRRALLIGLLGMAVPGLAGLLAGQPRLGFTIGLGAMLLAGGEGASGAAEAARHPAAALLPGAVAVLLATLFAGHRWSDAAMTATATLAAAISGYSRPVAIAAVRFIVYLVVSLNLADSAGHHAGGAVLVFGLGALWNVCLRMLLAGRAETVPGPGRVVTARQRWTHLKRGWRTRDGWQFTIRIGAGLTIATMLRRLWSLHHFGWIVLTVALLTQRALEPVPVRATQRMLGTLLGVALTWLLVTVAGTGLGLSTPASWLLAAAVCGLATLAPVMRTRNYLAYSALAAPVILLVLDLGRRVEPALLTDRLIATLIAGVIVVALNMAMLRLAPPPPAA